MKRLRPALLLLAGLLPRPVGALEQLPPAYLFLVAKEEIAAGELERALASLGAVVSAAPDDPYLRVEVADLLVRLGRTDEASEEAALARQLAPDEPQVLRTQGRIELARSDEEPAAEAAAREAFERLRTLAPEDLEVLVSLGQLYLAAGQPGLAAEVLSEAVRLRPDHPWIETLHARALAGSGDARAVSERQRDLLARDPRDLGARFELAEQLMRAGDPSAAAEQLAAAPADQREHPELRERLARAHFLAGQPESALALAEGVVREFPDVRRPRLLLVRVEIALGYFAAAERHLAPLLGPGQDPMLTELEVRSLVGQGKRVAAVAALDRRRSAARESGDTAAATALALEMAGIWATSGEWERVLPIARGLQEAEDPERARAALRLEGLALVRAGRLDEALARLESSARLDAQRAALLRVELLLEGDRKSEALAEARRLAAAWPGGTLAVAGRLQDAGLYQESLPLLQRSVDAAPESIEAAFRLATCLERLQRFDEAVEALRRVLERAPKLPPALNYLGYLWIERGENLDEALGMVNEAVRLDPDNGAYVDSLGWGLYQAGRFSEAVAALERASRLQPRDATILEHLGDARAAAGDLAGAREAYLQALESGRPGALGEIHRKLSDLGGGS